MNRGLEALYDLVAQCNRCGFCQTACPVFRATGHEIGVARGRLSLVRALIEQRLDWSDELRDPLFACLLCGACTAHCFPGIPTSDILVAARAEYLEAVGRSRLARLLFHHLLPYPERLRSAVRAVALGRKHSLASVAHALGLLRVFGRDFPRSQDMVRDLPEQALRDRPAPWTLPGQGDGPSIGYFAGCGMDLLFPDTARTTLRALTRQAGSVTVLNNACCGLPAYAYGDRETARRLARRNLSVLEGRDLKRIITDCSSCASFLKRYPALFSPEEPEHARAVDVASRVRDLVELLSAEECDPDGSFEPTVVTYHQPCHAVRGQHLPPPAGMLEGHPAYEYREMDESDWCCGGAGAYALFHYDLAMKVLRRKMENIRRTGAELVLTSCPACMMQLRHGARLYQVPVRVGHVSECMGPRVRGAPLP